MRKGENIRLRNDGRYEARYYDEQKKSYVSVYGKTYSEAKKKRNAIKSTPVSLKPVIEPSNPPVVAFKAVMLTWLDNQRKQIKLSTYSKYYETIHRHILPELGKMNIYDISQGIIDNFIQKKLSHGRIDQKGGLSAYTVKEIVNIIKQCLDNNGLYFKYKVTNNYKENIKIMSDEEYSKFINFLSFSIDNYKVSMLLALLTGIRIGELCALKWENIDLNNRVIKVRYTLQRIKNTNNDIPSKTVIVIDRPKSYKSIRDIPIIDFLYNLLVKIRKDNNYYILSASTKYIEPRICQNIFKNILKTVGIHDINFHVLRHTFATKAINAGLDAKTVSELLGHSNVNFTMNCYVHSNIEHKRKELEKINPIIISGQN